MAKEISHKNKNLRGEKNLAESKLRRSILIFSKEQRLKLVEINNQLIVQDRNLNRCEQELLAKEMKKKPEQVQRFINNLRAGLYPRLCQKVLVFKSYEEKNNLFANLDYFTTPKNMANLMKYLSSGQEKDLDELGPTEEPTDMLNQTKIEYGKILVNNLIYNSMNFGPIIANNQEEVKHIVELFNFKVQEREKKDQNGNRSTRAICTPKAVFKARAVLPSYVVEYLDYAFKENYLKMRSERKSSGLQNPVPVPLEGEIYKCGLCSKMYRSTQDVETHFEVDHNIGENMPKSSEPAPLEVKIYKCGFCSKMYGSTQDVETHFEVYHNIGASIPKDYHSEIIY